MTKSENTVSDIDIEQEKDSNRVVKCSREGKQAGKKKECEL